MTLQGGQALLRVTVRAAASAEIGAGHVARTAAVAQALQQIGAEIRWACDTDTLPYLQERGVAIDRIHVLGAAATAGRQGEIEASEIAQASDATETAAIGNESPDWMLVDSYQLGAAWQHAARVSGARIAAFDDLANRPLDADLVINAAASTDVYATLAPQARVLSGLRFAIIGDCSRPPAADPGSLLLAFGAADPGNLTEATLRELAARASSLPGGPPRTIIQLGRHARSHDRVQALARELPWASFAPAGPTTPGAPTLAIGAAGVGLLERMQAGVPSVVLVAAPNQRALAHMAERAGATVIEKHFTLSRADGGVDSAFSLEPAEMRALVEETHRAWQGLGTVSFGTGEAEAGSRMFRRSLYFVRDLAAGSTIGPADVRAIRPGNGLPPSLADLIVGRALRVSAHRGMPVSWKCL